LLDWCFDAEVSLTQRRQFRINIVTKIHVFSVFMQVMVAPVVESGGIAKVGRDVMESATVFVDGCPSVAALMPAGTRCERMDMHGRMAMKRSDASSWT
jgi:hypothetical protein